MFSSRMNVEESFNIGGRDLHFNAGSLATQANGSVLVRYGDTMVLVTATASDQPREGIDFFPLTVDYEERLYAVGKIPGGFIKREGRPSETATLSSRLIDRPLRPLFPDGYRNDVHIVATVLSVDQDNRPNIAAINGASAALLISGIPFNNAVAAVNVGRVEGELVINPTIEQVENSELDLIVAGTKDAVMMVEAGASELSEETMVEAIKFAHYHIKEIVNTQETFRDKCEENNLTEEQQVIEISESLDEELKAEAAEISRSLIKQAIDRGKEEKLPKLEREWELKEARAAVLERLQEKYASLFEEEPGIEKSINNIIGDIEKDLVRKLILKDKVRVDGRKLDEIRNIECKVSFLPRTHGSALFLRGETQVLTIGTLGALGEEQILDGIEVEESKRFLHHYNFPPYSVGEAKFMRGPSRREIGHGALAGRALEGMLPSEDDFPYTIRLVSEVLESNGSTSMASVCASSLALMDAGVPVKAPVAGIAMGLVKENDNVSILTDIQGIEDALGDMDFKVAGTREGITALQMDIKISGLEEGIFREALYQAREARFFILDKMADTISAPREHLSPYAPRIIKTMINPDKIRDVIGPGGKIIKKIIDELGVKVDIEDDGRVYVASVDQDSAEKALKVIKSLTEEVEIGKIYTGKVTKTTDFGAFVEVVPGVMGLPGKEGMVHISQLDEKRTEKVEDIVKPGDEILVKAVEFDHLGRLKLSHKDALREKKRNEGKNEENQSPKKDYSDKTKKGFNKR